MKKYKCVIFDLDGTLVNTFPGIFNSYQYASGKMGLPSPTEKIVGEAIGAPLKEVFIDRYGLSEEDANEAMKHYRQYYAEHGVLEATHYDGMEDTLKFLKNAGYLLGVATLKKETFAKTILDILGLSQYMDVIVGMDDGDHLTKAEMIKKVLDLLNQEKSKAVLVGDSSYDAIGAKEAGVDFVAVTYGFGFNEIQDVSAYSNVGSVSFPLDLMNIL